MKPSHYQAIYSHDQDWSQWQQLCHVRLQELMNCPGAHKLLQAVYWYGWWWLWSPLTTRAIYSHDQDWSQWQQLCHVRLQELMNCPGAHKLLQPVCWYGWWLWSPLTTRLYIVTIRTGVSDNSYVMSGCRSLWTAQVLISSCSLSADMGGGYEALSLPGYI